MAKKNQTPIAPTPKGFPRISEAIRKVPIYAYCDSCNTGWLNDTDVSHPLCPNDNVEMAIISKEGAENKIAQEAKLRKIV